METLLHWGESNSHTAAPEGNTITSLSFAETCAVTEASVSTRILKYGLPIHILGLYHRRLEADGDPSENPTRGIDHRELVENRRLLDVVVEQIAYRNHELPLRAVPPDEREKLENLHAKTAVDVAAVRRSRNTRHEAGVIDQAICRLQSSLRGIDRGAERRGDVVNLRLGGERPVGAHRRRGQNRRCSRGTDHFPERVTDGAFHRPERLSESDTQSASAEVALIRHRE